MAGAPGPDDPGGVVTGRPKGEGSIYQAADGRWHGSMDLGVKVNGKRDRRHVTAKTKTAVAKKLKQLRDDRDSGVVGGGRTITVEVWARTWLANCGDRLKPRTLDSYRTYVESYIIPHVGHKRLDRLNRADCEAMWRNMANQQKRRGTPGERLSSGTVHSARRILRACLSEAEDRGLVARNAAADARPTRLVEKQREWHSKEEARRVVVAAARRRNGARWVIALLGLRQAEALGLCWDDLDLEAKPARLSISRTVYRATWRHGCHAPAACTYVNSRGVRRKADRAALCPARIDGGLIVGTPKSSSATRSFALPAGTVTVLGQHRKAQAAERLAAGDDWVQGPNGGWVFANIVGGPTDPKADYNDWAALLEAAGVRYITVHGARHTAASLALSDHIEARVIMARMGWSNSTLLDRYQHPLTEADEEAAEAMDAALFGQASRPKPRRRRSG